MSGYLQFLSFALIDPSLEFIRSFHTAILYFRHSNNTHIQTFRLTILFANFCSPWIIAPILNIEIRRTRIPFLSLN